MATTEVDGYEVYHLSNGDITVGKGAWLILRWYKYNQRAASIDYSAPREMIDGAREVLKKVLANDAR